MWLDKPIQKLESVEEIGALLPSDAVSIRCRFDSDTKEGVAIVKRVDDKVIELSAYSPIYGEVNFIIKRNGIKLRGGDLFFSAYNGNQIYYGPKPEVNQEVLHNG